MNSLVFVCLAVFLGVAHCAPNIIETTDIVGPSGTIHREQPIETEPAGVVSAPGEILSRGVYPYSAYPYSAGAYPYSAGAYPYSAYPYSAGAYPYSAGAYPYSAGAYPYSAYPYSAYPYNTYPYKHDYPYVQYPYPPRSLVYSY